MSEPLYRIVFNKIISRIADGTHPPGSMLPSEIDIGLDLNVSQGTARKALIELERKGIIERRQGRGTFVTLRTPESSLFHFFRMRDADGNQVVPDLDSETITRRKSRAEEASALFGTPEEVYQISRIRNFEGKALSHETIVVSTKLFPGLQERGPLPNSLYVLFQHSYSCIIISAREKLRASVLGTDLAAVMNCDPATPVIEAFRESLDLLDRVVELRTSLMITENVFYSITLE